MNRRMIFASVAVPLVLATVALMVLHYSRASAQEDSVAPASSAESGSPLALPNYPPEPAAPEAVISWRVVGSALRPRENDVNYLTNGPGGCVYVTAGDISTVWNFPVQLPQGALVDNVRFYFYDLTPGTSTAYFTIYDLYGSVVEEWDVSSLGNSGYGFNDTGLINHTIDYDPYSYALNWRPSNAGSSMQLCGFRVFFTAPMFGAGFVPVIHNENP